MLPFHSFGSDSSEHIDSYKEMYLKAKVFGNGNPFIFCGDLNTSKLCEIVPEMYTEMICTFDKATRYNGHQNDYIFVSKDLRCKSYGINMNNYDHFFCMCEIELMPQNAINILHLSDLHYMSLDSSIDQKTRLPNVDSSDIRKNIFMNKIKSISNTIDYVIVSGDITTQGKKEGFDEFNNFMNQMQKTGVFPPSNKIVIVPGNHDVGGENRWNNFNNVLNGCFVRPWLENLDKKTDDLLECFSKYFTGNTINGVIEEKNTFAKIHFPFILDIEKQVFIYAFNSSSISQSEIVLNDDDKNLINQIKNRKGNSDAKKILSILDKELKIDPARIDPQEIFLFEKFVEIIKQKIDLSTFYKIAVLHHHTTTISCSEEIKKFDHITNAGEIKKQLSNNGFQIIFHGHKHSADIFFDTAVANHKKMLIVSGGTVFGYPTERGCGFYLHTFDENVLRSNYIFLDDKTADDCVVTKLNGGIYNKAGISLGEMFKNIEQRIVQHINREEINGKNYMGWSKNIEDRKVGSISTVYGILILDLLKSNHPYYINNKDEIINSLWQFRHESGGWGAVSQITNTGAPEATAWVALALFVAGSPLYKDALNDLYIILERMAESINSNFTLALVINILCIIDPQSKYIVDYCEKLLDSAIWKDGKIKYWQNKCKKEQIINIEPSIVHTASAMIALYNSQKLGAISIELKSKLSDTREVLLNRDLWENTREAISIQIGDKEDSLIVDYYTATWVLKALLIMDSYVDENIIQDLLNKILNDYSNGYWKYNNSHYIWAIYDALTALESYFMSF